MSTDFDESTQITRTRVVVPPRRSNLVVRQRLIDLFYKLPEYKLMLVSAPAGYGKTSLLIDVAHQTEFPACWYSVDSLDTNPYHFIAHFNAALARQFPVFGKQTAAILQTTQPNLAGLDSLVTTIVNELHESIQDHFIFILDDYHLASNEILDHFVNQFIYHTGEYCHLVIISRSQIQLPDLSLLVGRNQVEAIGATELAFRADEIQALVQQTYHQTISLATAQKLVDATEGWITGLLLSASTLWQNVANQQLRVSQVAGVDLYDYMAQQVFEQQSAHMQDFLLRTALLKEFDADLCRQVLGRPQDPNMRWSDLIEIARRRNLFVQPIETLDGQLRYHPLFQDFLQTTKARKNPEQTAQIVDQLAKVYLKQQAWEKAHTLYQQRGNTNAAADVICRAGGWLVKNGRFKTLSKWIDDLPQQEINNRPLLVAMRGYATAMNGKIEPGLALLNLAKTSLNSEKDHHNLIQTVIWRSVVNCLSGNYQAALTDAEAALEKTRQNGQSPEFEIEALRVKGQSLLRMGQAHQATECLEQALQLSQQLDDDEYIARLHLEMGTAYMAVGYYVQAHDYYHNALKHWRKTGNILRQADLLNKLGILFSQRGDYERAASVLEEGLKYAQQSGNVRREGFILCSIGNLYSRLDILKAAHAAYHQANPLAQRLSDRFLQVNLVLARTALARTQQNYTLAQNLLDVAQALIKNGQSPYEQTLYQLERGQLALALDNHEQAIRHLQEVAYRLEHNGQLVKSSQAYLYLAMAHYVGQNPEQALCAMQHAFWLGTALQSHHPLMQAGKTVKPLLEWAQEQPALGYKATHLLNQIKEFEKRTPTLRRHLRQKISKAVTILPKLTIKTLGKTQLLCDGKPVTCSQWQTQRRVRELFYYILAHSDDGLTREAIGTVFWPDSSAKQLAQQFKNAIYKLRRAVDKDIILYKETQDRYYFNRNLDYEYDVELFYNYITQAQTASIIQEKIAAYKVAIKLYQGSYLLDVDGTWVLTEREQLRRIYIEANIKLIELYLETVNYKLAITYCQQTLLEDPYHEELHRQAMRAYAALGNKAALVRQYKQCSHKLKKDFAASVSPQTKALFKALVG